MCVLFMVPFVSPHPFILPFTLQNSKFAVSRYVFLFAVAYYLLQNAGDIARKYIRDPDLLSFIDAEVCKVKIMITIKACPIVYPTQNSL